MRAGALGRVAQIAIEHQIKVGDFFGAADFVPVTQAHIMADTRASASRRALARGARRCRRGGARVRIRPSPIRAAPDFAKAVMLKQAVDADARAARDRRVRAARRRDDRHLHQLPDDPGADARRAPRVRRHRRRDLFECDLRRALELRGRPVGAVGRPDRPHAALRLPPRRAAAGDGALPGRRDAAEPQRLGRARRRDRTSCRQLLGRAVVDGLEGVQGPMR